MDTAARTTDLQFPRFQTTSPNGTVIGTVTITPTTGSNPFELSGSGEGWVAEGQALTLTPASESRVLYVLTFGFPATSSGFGFDAVAVEVSKRGEEAFICQLGEPGAATVTLNLIDALTSGSAQYDLGFHIVTPNGSTIPWDPAVAFNPPD
ncbi:MAG TPA: hypothetical protein VLT87_16620 [Thermoanaerobaculia bacterium]|nr:hypothetical protein [Thermoanaerobaculia bacterium]